MNMCSKGLYNKNTPYTKSVHAVNKMPGPNPDALVTQAQLWLWTEQMVKLSCMVHEVHSTQVDPSYDETLEKMPGGE